jgi:uncharacterized membrane protein
MIQVLLVISAITTFVLVGVLAGLMVTYQLRDRLDSVVKLLEKQRG